MPAYVTHELLEDEPNSPTSKHNNGTNKALSEREQLVIDKATEMVLAANNKLKKLEQEIDSTIAQERKRITSIANERVASIQKESERYASLVREDAEEKQRRAENEARDLRRALSTIQREKKILETELSKTAQDLQVAENSARELEKQLKTSTHNNTSKDRQLDTLRRELQTEQSAVTEAERILKQQASKLEQLKLDHKATQLALQASLEKLKSHISLSEHQQRLLKYDHQKEMDAILHQYSAAEKQWLQQLNDAKRNIEEYGELEDALTIEDKKSHQALAFVQAKLAAAEEKIQRQDHEILHAHQVSAQLEASATASQKLLQTAKNNQAISRLQHHFRQRKADHLRAHMQQQFGELQAQLATANAQVQALTDSEIKASHSLVDAKQQFEAQHLTAMQQIESLQAQLKTQKQAMQTAQLVSRLQKQFRQHKSIEQQRLTANALESNTTKQKQLSELRLLIENALSAQLQQLQQLQTNIDRHLSALDDRINQAYKNTSTIATHLSAPQSTDKHKSARRITAATALQNAWRKARLQRTQTTSNNSDLAAKQQDITTAATRIQHAWRKKSHAKAQRQSHHSTTVQSQSPTPWQHWQPGVDVPSWLSAFLHSPTFTPIADQSHFVFNQDFKRGAQLAVDLLKNPREKTETPSKILSAGHMSVDNGNLIFKTITQNKPLVDLQTAMTQIHLSLSAVLSHSNKADILSTYFINITYPEVILRQVHRYLSLLSQEIPDISLINIKLVDDTKNLSIDWQQYQPKTSTSDSDKPYQQAYDQLCDHPLLDGQHLLSALNQQERVSATSEYKRSP